MADLWLEWNDDLRLTADNDLMLVEGSEETRQSIIRRLFTNGAGGYLWALEYGAGLPRRIGRVAREAVIAAIVRAQIALEATVASLPVPKITVTAPRSNAGLHVIDIGYTDAVTGAAIAVTFQTPGER